MREPYQILSIPYRIVDDTTLFCIFCRTNGDYCQFITGGGENNEKPSDAAQREIKEETGVTAEKLTELKSVAFVSAEIVTETVKFMSAKKTEIL